MSLRSSRLAPLVLAPLAFLGWSCSLVIDLPELPFPFCGDGMVAEGEECDDGNDVPGDGCNPPCKSPLERVFNSTLEGEQGNPKIAFFNNGAFMVAFEDDSNQPPDIDGLGAVRALHFDPSGQPAGLDFVLPQATGKEQEHVDLAANEIAVVVWEDESGVGPDLDRAVRARRFSQNGGALGSELVVNTTLPGAQRYPAVAARPGGGFLVVWLDESLGRIYGRLLDGDGTPLGDEIAISAAGAKERPAVAASDDRYLVVWPDDGAQTADIYAAFVDPNGAAGTPFLVNSTLTAEQKDPAVAFDPMERRFAVAWTDASGASDSDGSGIRARLLTGEDSFVGPDFPVNEAITGNQEVPAIAASMGVFLIVWSTVESSDIHARRVQADGALLEPDVVLNTITDQDQVDPDTAAGPSGFYVLWEDESGAAPDLDQAVRGLMVPVR